MNKCDQSAVEAHYIYIQHKRKPLTAAGEMILSCFRVLHTFLVLGWLVLYIVKMVQMCISSKARKYGGVVQREFHNMEVSKRLPTSKEVIRVYNIAWDEFEP